MKTTGVSCETKFGLLGFLGHPSIQETFWINLKFRSKKIHTNFVTWRHKWVVELGPGEPVAIFGSPSSQTGAQNSLWWGWKLFCSRSGIFCLKVFGLWLLQDPEFALKTFLLTVSWWLWWTTFETLNKVERSEVHQAWNGSIQSSLRTNEILLFTASLSKDIQDSTPTYLNKANRTSRWKQLQEHQCQWLFRPRQYLGRPEKWKSKTHRCTAHMW